MAQRGDKGTFKSLIGLAGQSARNVVWNLGGGIWAGLLIVLVTPWYVSRLGLDGYGVLSLWLMMQVLMGLLDMGMGATLIREFAASRSDASGLEFRRDLLRTLEIVYWAAATALALMLVLGAQWLADDWLKSDSDANVGTALRVMAVALGLQFPCAVYSNGLAGLQAQGRMNALQIAGNSLRYGSGALALWWRADLAWFFAVQAVVAAGQTFVTRATVRGMIAGGMTSSPSFRVQILERLWRYSLGMGLTSVTAVLLANADRIALSALVPTTELGKYAVAFTATGLLQLGIQPFYRAFFPRYSQLAAMGDQRQLRDEYFRSCRVTAIVIIPIAVVGGVFAPQLFQAWLGSSDDATIEVFRWLLAGITCSGLMWLPAALQQAQGWTRLHTAMITGALVLGAPVMIWAIKTHGIVGASVVWVLHGISGITLELWLMHRRLLVGELRAWYRTVLAQPLFIAIPVVGLSKWMMPPDLSAWVGPLWASVTGLLAVVSTLFISFAGNRFSSRTPV